ncbi:MAG: class I SAM-dependent RNA methyltransferase [Propionibacteriaceae bacterium]|jgi:tRNA/tmRNA/rRNA uracil-C5-methylase (TrmA/RlmC/RlmD family)|nr:class I SAM-dependent RNA methyltransferase [Propionibacteriaceae bacterium]
MTTEAADRIGPLRIGPPAHGGVCVARHDGRVVFVAGVLPGELAWAEVTRRQTRQWHARAVEILEAAPDRVEHVWPLAAAAGVGGADLGHVALPAQRTWKAAVTAGQLRRLAGLERTVQVEAAPGDDARGGRGWRTRLDFEADAAGRLAMHAAGSHRLVPVDSMPLAHEAIVEAAPWRQAYPPGAQVRVVRSAGAAADGSAAQTTVAVRGDDPGWVDERVPLPDGGAALFRLPATAFWQVHRAAPAVLTAAVSEAAQAGAGQRVFDLYSGVGLFTAPLAAAVGRAGQVWAVEGALAASAAAAANTAAWPAARCLHGAVADQLHDRSGPLPARADVVVLDPPRNGAGRRVLAGVTARQPRRIVYVACDPAALARDLGSLAAAGYPLAGLRAFDLFPHTHHVECVAVCERA